jgi:hypothetical protein
LRKIKIEILKQEDENYGKSVDNKGWM